MELKHNLYRKKRRSKTLLIVLNGIETKKEWEKLEKEILLIVLNGIETLDLFFQDTKTATF